MFLTDRDYTGLLTDPQFQVFDHPDAFLTCNKDPDKALCDPQCGTSAGAGHTPSALERCDAACANIARTDTLMRAAQAEIDLLEAEVTDPLTPQPLAARQRRRAASLQAMIDRHHATRTVIDVKELRRPPMDSGELERQAIEAAVRRLLEGTSARSNGSLTILTLA